jgi:two-component system, chemotaxis family, response regulator Rcp1
MEGGLKTKSGDPAKILVMEDNPADVTLLRMALETHDDDYAIEVLRDGAEALAFIQRQRLRAEHPEPCVIVMDMHLPKHDAPTVLHALRDAPALAHIHVVVLTSVAAPADEAEVRQLGIRLYRTKPFEIDGWNALAGKILDICHNRTPVPSKQTPPGGYPMQFGA